MLVGRRLPAAGSTIATSDASGVGGDGIDVYAVTNVDCSIGRHPQQLEGYPNSLRVRFEDPDVRDFGRKKSRQ